MDDYDYDILDGKATIARYNGEGGAVTVPSTLGGFSVTTIGTGAFRGRSGITAVTLPEGLTGIGDDAFRNCVSLTAINLPRSLTSIGYGTFSGCISLKIGF